MENRNFLKAAAVTIPVLLTGILIYLFLSFKKKNEKIEALQHMPTFSLMTTDNTVLSSKSLINEKTKIIIYFSPSCHYCQAEAKELSETYSKYQNIQWVWIASEPVNEIKQFADTYKLDQKPDIFWCHDEMATFYQKLGMNTVPYFLVYDQYNNLIKRNSGAIKLEKLVNISDEKK